MDEIISCNKIQYANDICQISLTAYFNVKHYLRVQNAGDTVRHIVLFYKIFNNYSISGNSTY